MFSPSRLIIRLFVLQGDVALVLVSLVTVEVGANTTTVTELASSTFLVSVDSMAQLSLPGSWAAFGGVDQLQVRAQRVSCCFRAVAAKEVTKNTCFV
jgi:hypothetical protein